MSANDYITSMRIRNARLFNPGVRRINVTIESFEEIVRHAYEAGKRDGKDEANAGKALFEQLFGK